MSSYLLLDILVFFFPFVLSFDKKVAFYKHWPSVFSAIGLVGFIYIIWDVFATLRGDWSFSTDHTVGIRIFHLPLEEILFFLVVPYACIFIYEVIRAYFPEKKLREMKWLPVILGLVLITAGLIFYDQPYTLTVLIVSGTMFLLYRILAPEIMSSSWFWISLGISYVPFLIANGFLTGIPIVLYGEGHIWGLRIITIPLEDFFYSFSLLGYNLLIHILLRERLKIGKNQS